MNQLITFVTKHLLLCGAFVVALALWINFELRQKIHGSNQISAQQAVQLHNQDNAIIVDIRDKAAYQTGHITGAIHKTIEKMQATSLDLDKDKSIILVCKNGNESSKLANTMKHNGYTNVCILKDGITGWQNASFPLIKS